MSTASLEPMVLAWVQRALRGEQVVAMARLRGGYVNENIAIATDGGRYRQRGVSSVFGCANVLGDPGVEE